MAKQKPPDPKGKTTGFPNQLLWEQLGSEWEKLGGSAGAVSQFEILSEKLASRGGSRQKVTRDLVAAMLSSREVGQKTRELLTDGLYGLAAAYLLPRVQTELGFSPNTFRKELRQLAREADAFVDTYKRLHPLTNVALWNHDKGRSLDAVNETAPFEPTIAFLEELSAAVKLLADDIPKWKRGTSANTLNERFLNSTISLIHSADLGPIECPQYDGTRRNYRPKSKSAEVLFDYVKLVDPHIAGRTIVRVLGERRDLLPNEGRPGGPPPR